MRAPRWVSRSAATAAVVLAVGGTILAAAPAATAGPGPAPAAGSALAADPAPLHPPQQTELHVREELVSLNVVDNVGYYDYVIRDLAGAAIGRTVGFCRLLSIRQSDNHEIAWCEDTMTFDTGALRTFGVIDQTTAFQGVPLTLHVVGVSGVYQHSVGIRQWQALAPGLALAKSDIVLWGGSDGSDSSDISGGSSAGA